MSASGALGVHAVRIDREAGVLARKALLGFGEPALVAHHVHEVGRVAAVEHAEALVEPERLGRCRRIRRLAIEWKVPDQGSRTSFCTSADDALRAARHLERRAAREGQQQDALGLGALQNQMRDPVRQRVGLAGAGARDDEQRLRGRRSAASRCRGFRRSKAAAVLTAATIGQCCINFQYLGLQSVWNAATRLE